MRGPVQVPLWLGGVCRAVLLAGKGVKCGCQVCVASLPAPLARLSGKALGPWAGFVSSFFPGAVLSLRTQSGRRGKLCF